MKKIITLLALFSIVGCGQNTFTDPRDGKKYKTVKIGKQTWMAENLNYEAKGSVCYDNDEANCKKYGRLYDWETAMKACPEGWHLPSKSEYEVLDKAVGGEEVACKKLKSKSGWNKNYGTDEFGFTALPGGGYYSGGNFGDVVNGGYWWSASEYDAGSAYSRIMLYYNDYVQWSDYENNFLHSVRCVQGKGNSVKDDGKVQTNSQEKKEAGCHLSVV